MENKIIRIDWIDGEKGFVLLLVCLFHIELFSFLAPCRMPIFFFLSGLLYSNRRYPTFSSYLKRKWDTLLKPYILLSFLSIIFYPTLYDGSILSGGAETSFSGYLSSIHIPEFFILFLNKLYIFTIDILSGHSSPTSVGLWFVYSLFQISCIFYIIHKFFSKSKYCIWLFSLLSIGCLIGGWWMSKYNITAPFKIPTMITGLAFYIMGYLSKPFFFNSSKSLHINKIILIIIFLFILYNMGNLMVTDIFTYRLNQLPNSFLGYAILSIIGIWLVTLIFLVINNYKNPLLSKVIKPFMNCMEFIAENGLIILAVHMWALSWYNYIFGIYKENNWYVYIALIWVILITGLLIPIFNNKLYWAIGKKKPLDKK